MTIILNVCSHTYPAVKDLRLRRACYWGISAHDISFDFSVRPFPDMRHHMSHAEVYYIRPTDLPTVWIA